MTGKAWRVLSVVFIIAALIPCSAAAASRQSPAGKPPSLTEKIDIFPEPVAYDLKFKPNYEDGTLAAFCELTLRNPGREPLSIVPLNLYRLFDIDSLTDGRGRKLEYAAEVLSFEDWKEFQVKHIRVRLASPLQTGATVVIRMNYSGPFLGYAEAMRYVQDHVDRDMTIIRMDGLPYPQIGVPSYKDNRALGLKDFTYRAAFTVPAPLIVANAGRLVSKTVSGDLTTFVYESLVPSWRIDLVAADYEIIESPDGKFRVFALRPDAEGGRALMNSLSGVLKLYTGWFGPLKSFGGLTVIEIPASCGSQADKAAIIQEAGAFKNPAQRYTFYHELSHFWNAEARDPLPARFESEGLAMFLQHLVQEKLEGQTGAVDAAVTRMLARTAGSFADHPDWKNVPMIAYGEKQMTDMSYRIGQVLFYLLHETMGEQAFLDCVGGFYQEYSGKGATSREFVEYFKAHSPLPLDKLLADWVFTAEGPRLISAGTTPAALTARYR